MNFYKAFLLIALVGIQNSLASSSSKALLVGSLQMTSSVDQKDPNLKQIAPGHVRVYHNLHNHIGFQGDLLTSIREHGLLTRNELFKRGLIQKKAPQFADKFKDHDDVIYFAWKPNKPDHNDYVALDVDPTTTYVYNREFRADMDFAKYNGSKLLLSDYLERVKNEDEAREACPQGRVFIRHPLSAQPVYLSPYDRNVASGGYLNEIIIHQPCISPDQLIFPE